MKRSSECATRYTLQQPAPRAYRRSRLRGSMCLPGLGIAALGEIGCVILLVVLILLLLLVSGSLDQSALRALSSDPDGRPTDLPNPIYNASVATRACTVLLRTGRNRLECQKLPFGEPLQLVGLETSGVTAVSQSEDGRFAAIGYFDGSVLVRSGGDPCFRAVKAHSEPVTDVAISGDDRFAVSSSSDGSALVWSLQNCKPVLRLRVASGPGCTRTQAAFSRNGELVTVGTSDGSICCWRTADGSLVSRIVTLSALSSVAFSFDAKNIFVANVFGRSIHCLEMSSGRELWTHRSSDSDTYLRIAVSPDGTALAAGTLYGEVLIIDPESGELLEQVSAHNEQISSLQYSPDGRRFFSASVDGTLAVWRSEDVTEALSRTTAGRW